ncbi:hypothetical protein DU508_00085 [Pedobacter chinensis]|uniref:Uncharacterized protein n=1 Tax=Pedobacter chinensis TaxID=2282421 RepID=A0A369Q1R5_9SPHI|nr:hypothetical protein [Pedobacter chinensis]RDC58442.1 hypothetical protein DU508_00085 [Pedobacter chinensis]
MIKFIFKPAGCCQSHSVAITQVVHQVAVLAVALQDQDVPVAIVAEILFEPLAGQYEQMENCASAASLVPKRYNFAPVSRFNFFNALGVYQPLSSHL